MSTYKLVMQYTCSDGKTFTQTVNYARSPQSMEATAVNNFMAKCIENTSVFNKTLTGKKAAYIVESDTTDITLS